MTCFQVHGEAVQALVPALFHTGEHGGDLIRDFMALNKVELLPWDAWGYMTMMDEEAATLDLQKMDALADLCMNVETRFDELRRVAENDPCLRIPDGWTPAQPPAWSPF